jgi:hypothetical protein
MEALSEANAHQGHPSPVRLHYNANVDFYGMSAKACRSSVPNRRVFLWRNVDLRSLPGCNLNEGEPARIEGSQSHNTFSNDPRNYPFFTKIEI